MLHLGVDLATHEDDDRESHIQTMKPMTAPSEPYVAL
jgi:hypothetical protein